MNPEFLRLARLELTPLRLIGAPLLLGLYLLVAALPERSWENVLNAAFYAVLVVAAFWGARRAADAVASEIRERTWDAQRLSGLGPISMTVGKLFGAPIGAWCVIGLCALVQVALIATNGVGDYGERFAIFGFGATYQAVIAQMFGAFALFAIAAFGALTALSGQERARSFDTTLFQAVAVAGGAFLTSIFLAANFSSVQLVYYGLDVTRAEGLALSFAFFGLWAALGLGHQMRKTFGAPTTALPWILFLGALALFVQGWSREAATLTIFSFLAASYVSALLEPHRAIDLKSWAADLGRGRLGQLISGPAWLYAWIALAISLGVFFQEFDDELSDLFRGGVAQFDPVGAHIAFGLFVLRDIGVCVWAGLRARDGRGLWTAALVIAALWVVPTSFASAGAGLDLLQFFVPLGDVSAFSAGVQAAISFGAALALLTRKR